MKKIFLIATFIFCGISATKAQEETFSLTVYVSKLKSNDGSLLVGLYNREASFLKKSFKSAVAKVENKKSVVVFKNVPKGTYAISFVHDANDNNKMDTNFFGIPKEDYGCSNNAKGFVGPPKYEDAKFSLKENKTIEITM